MTRIAAIRSTAVAVALVVALSACGGSPGAAPPVAYTAAGTWAGVYTFTGRPGGYNARYTLTDSGGTLGGSVVFSDGDGGIGPYTTSGTRDSGNAVTLRNNRKKTIVVTTGTFSGNTFSGRFTTIDGDFLTDAGTVTLTRAAP